MKKYLLYVLTAFVLLVSCSSKDDENSAESNILTGTWNLVAQSQISTATITQGTNVFITKENAVGKDFNFKIIFSENPNTITSQGSYTLVTTYSSTGEPDEVNESTTTADNDGVEGNWSLSGSRLTIVNDDEASVFDVTIIDNKTISLNFKAEQTETEEETTFAVTVEIDITLAR